MSTDIDDHTATVSDHPFTSQSRKPERPLQVQIDHGVEEFFRYVGERVVVGGHPRVVDQHVELAESLIGGVDKSVEFRPPADVYGVGHSGATGFRLDLCGGGDAVVVFAACNDYVGAAARSREGHLTAQTAAAAGHQDHPVGQVEQLLRLACTSAHRRSFRCYPGRAPYRCSMQILLIRHALPLRTQAGEGSDPELAAAGWEQARRLPEALARFPISRLVSSPQRRAVQTAEPVAAARQLTVSTDERLAEYDRGHSHYVPLEQVRAERPDDWDRMASGKLPASVDVGAFADRVSAGLSDIVAAANHRDTVAVFSHGGVINVILHGILGTAQELSFPIDYASVTQLRCSRSGAITVAGVNGVEHVWDLLPRNRS